jgi:exopolyphosphatase / guanosine-5'-triphosphate,3'-diphosphate pyrophosphatase
MRISSIDIGTNTILLLIVNTDDNSILSVLHDEQQIPRLGKGVDERRLISKETFSRILPFFQHYVHVSKEYAVDRILAAGTSALRDAVNREDFCSFIFENTGIRIEILSGDEEAEWTYRGGISGFSAKASQFTVLDIGGGSTEIITGTHHTILSKKSLDIGCVRISERFLHSDPPSQKQISEARLFLKQAFATIQNEHLDTTFPIGVAGTLTTLGAIQLQLQSYDPIKITGYSLKKEEVSEIVQRLQMMTIEQIRAIPQISPGRLDIILAGSLILEEFLFATGISSITVSDRGLRYGLVLRELERMNNQHTRI